MTSSYNFLLPVFFALPEQLALFVHVIASLSKSTPLLILDFLSRSKLPKVSKIKGSCRHMRNDRIFVIDLHDYTTNGNLFGRDKRHTWRLLMT